ncbi:YfhO family protein [Secundilactobacillus collinoides]|uniref:YfhO family protein n=1 Tax=Secundilactobacillus collinoides TaxID=33960 RepID=UPI000AFAF72F|nr:YfhO family protein [Secundilactobacillus collinoides]
MRSELVPLQNGQQTSSIKLINSSKKIDHTFYRTANSSDYYTMPTVGNNLSMLLGTHSISSYYSVQSGAVDSFNRELGNAQTAMNNPTGNVDNRTTMLSLLGVKYLFTRQDDWVNKAPHPYGFSAVKTKSGHAKVFADHPVYQLGNGTGTVVLKNKYALPLAYLQTSQLTAKSFNRLSEPDKEQALLTGVQTSKHISGVAQTTAKPVSKSVAIVLVQLVCQSLLCNRRSVTGSTITLISPFQPNPLKMPINYHPKKLNSMPLQRTFSIRLKRSNGCSNKTSS